ncbi:hypothetical protein FQN60_003150 [Etheostoma spectabile]|uniref:Uncharacterized protein n=1 Tax=Etheostoma spectabile TaxID=54343 RepID=A0A5J5CLF4_9PERO|nr:hypothetical protein FQN60_003150 [Etheostoma spectabile]
MYYKQMKDSVTAATTIRFHTVQLIEQLQHCPLHLAVTTRSALQARRPNGVNLVHEDDGGCMFSGHDEQLTHHAGSCRRRG